MVTFQFENSKYRSEISNKHGATTRDHLGQYALLTSDLGE